MVSQMNRTIVFAAILRFANDAWLRSCTRYRRAAEPGSTEGLRLIVAEGIAGQRIAGCGKGSSARPTANRVVFAKAAAASELAGVMQRLKDG